MAILARRWGVEHTPEGAASFMRRMGVECAVVLVRGHVPQLRVAGAGWLEWDRTARQWDGWGAERVVDPVGWRERLFLHAWKKSERQTKLHSRTVRAA